MRDQEFAFCLFDRSIASDTLVERANFILCDIFDSMKRSICFESSE